MKDHRWQASLGILTVASAPAWSIVSYAVVFATGCVLAALHFLRLVRRRLHVSATLSELPFYALYIYVLASSWWAYDFAHSLRASLVLFGFLMLFVTFSSTSSFSRTRQVAVRSVLGLVLVSLLCTVACFLVFGAVRPEAKRTHFLGSFDTRLASYMATSMPLLVYATLRGRQRTWGLVAIAVAIAIGVATATRSGLLLPATSALASFLVMISSQLRTLSRRIISEAAILGVAIALLIVTAWISGFADQAVDRVAKLDLTELVKTDQGRIGPRGKEEEFGRKAMYAVGWKTVRQSRPLGIGYGSLGFVVEEEFGAFVMSHNLIITVLGELGWAGALLFLLCLASLLAAIAQAYDRAWSVADRQLVTALCLVLCVGFVVAQIRPQQDNPLLFLSAGLLFGIRRGEADYEIETVDY